MKKVLFIFSMIFLFTTYFVNNAKAQKDDKKKFKKEWTTVDSLDKLRLPESALKIVEKIYKSAKEKNYKDQIIKAFI